MVKAFDTYRAEEKRMQQRNVKEKHNLEENGVEMERQHFKRSEIIVREDMNWIYLAQDKRMWWALVNTQLKMLTRQNVENSSVSLGSKDVSSLQNP
jgi:hypothetical protein